ADGEPAIGVVDAQTDLEGLDVALGAADVALRGKPRIDAEIEDRAFALDARRQPYRQLPADRYAVDVRFLDVGADPEVIGVDQGHHRLSGVDDFARAHRTDVDDAVNRRVDFGVAQADVGLR